MIDLTRIGHTLAGMGLRGERPLQVQPIWTPDEDHPDIFHLILRFTHGAVKSWHLEAPKLPITDSWMKMALTHLVERIIGDLRFGYSEPATRPDKRAFHEFERHSDALVAALHDMLMTWARWRIELYRKRALPAWKFEEAPEAEDDGVDTGWRPPAVIAGEEPPGGW
jgi:hypothetical protein